MDDYLTFKDTLTRSERGDIACVRWVAIQDLDVDGKELEDYIQLNVEKGDELMDAVHWLSDWEDAVCVCAHTGGLSNLRHTLHEFIQTFGELLRLHPALQSFLDRCRLVWRRQLGVLSLERFDAMTREALPQYE